MQIGGLITFEPEWLKILSNLKESLLKLKYLFKILSKIVGIFIQIQAEILWVVIIEKSHKKDKQKNFKIFRQSYRENSL